MVAVSEDRGSRENGVLDTFDPRYERNNPCTSSTVEGEPHNIIPSLGCKA